VRQWLELSVKGYENVKMDHELHLWYSCAKEFVGYGQVHKVGGGACGLPEYERSLSMVWA